MKQQLHSFITVTAMVLLGSPLSFADGEVKSLRGATSIDASSIEPTVKQWQYEQTSFERTFAQDPPLIPHDIDGFEITRQANTCLACHSKANFQNVGAPMASATHFTNPDGEVLETVSGRRYFCNQCHVRQVEAEPLVQNAYQPPAK